MTQNDVTLLDRILSEEKEQRAPDWKEDDFFLYFCAEHWLKDFALSVDQISDGLVDGSHDLGIDGLWTMVEGRYLTPDFNLALVGERPSLHLTLIQAKNSGGFSEDALTRLCVNLPLLLNVERDEKTLSANTNAKVLERSARFLRAYEELGTRFPLITVDVVYFTRSPGKESGGVRQKATALRKALHDAIGLEVNVAVRFVNAGDLRQLAARRVETTRELRVAEGSMGTEFGDAVVCLVRFDDYFNFITNDEGELIPELFEANVRDYGGETSVNNAIQATLRTQKAEDFWWFNNGVTIVAKDLVPQPKRLIMRDPQIVNGLQTTNELHRYVSDTDDPKQDTRALLVRVVVPSGEEISDRIIRATNNQTALRPGSLRATEKVQKDIEEHLYDEGWYYERRAHYWSNQQMSIDRIVGMTRLAQDLLAFVQLRPHDSLTAADAVLEDQDEYERLFRETHNLEIYSVSLRVSAAIESYLKIRAESTNLLGGTVENWRFHLLAMTSVVLTGSRSPQMRALLSIDWSAVQMEIFNDLFDALQLAFTEALTVRRMADSIESAARNPDVTERALRAAQQIARRH
ncbi:AIPR family protein [Nocardioides campestrisoli]|uniref:AIPR family protein n=1 Tax=Nocardioides campestrisoli TaxID=2736757 RepID=UPI0015E643F8|nr:AIPR family protein [Nocardioides campestrisoli]